MRKILVGVLVVFSTAVHAEWELFSVNNNGDRFFLDRGSVKGQNFKRVWVKGELVKPDRLEGGRPFKSYSVLYEHDCREEMSRVLQTAMFEQSNLQGELVVVGRDKTNWQYMAPGSIGFNLHSLICGG